LSNRKVERRARHVVKSAREREKEEERRREERREEREVEEKGR
jgi:hypothetical protein